MQNEIGTRILTLAILILGNGWKQVSPLRGDQVNYYHIMESL
jgi:hypothetical protein